MSELNLINLSPTDILQTFRDAFYAQYDSQIKIGSEEYAAASVFTYCLGVLFNAMNVASQQRFIDTADGEFLDAIARTYGIESRPSGNYATCLVRLDMDEVTTVYSASTVEVADAAGHVFVNENSFSYGDRFSVLFRAVEQGSDYNGIPSGQLNVLVEPPSGINGAYSTSETGGGVDADAYKDDSLFREWLKNEIASYAGAGTAIAYRGRAMNVDSRILDAFVVEQGMDGYEKGKVQVYVLTDETVSYPQEVVERVQKSLTDRSFRPIGDFVIVRPSESQERDISGTCCVTYPLRFAAVAHARTSRIIREYRAYLRQKINRPFVYAEVVQRLKETDSDGIYAIEAVFTGLDNDEGTLPIYPETGSVLDIHGIDYAIAYDSTDA